MRVIDTLVTNYVGQPQVPQEVGGSGGDSPVAPTVPIMGANTGS